jgi:TetR/AcrR family transcriptional repressor of nem operon
MANPNLKQTIVEAGLDEFHRNGYNATGVQDIARAVGMPKGSFYYYFDSKEALAAEAVDLYGFGGVRRHVLADQAIAPVQRLRSYFTDLNTMFVGQEFAYGCLLGNLSAEMGDSSTLVRARLDAVYQAWTDDIAAAIRDGKADGSIRSPFPEQELAAFLLDAWEGAVLRARVSKSREALDIFMKLGLENLLA